MANEITFDGTPDTTNYVLIRDTHYRIWNTVLLGFDDYDSDDYLNYTIPAVEQGASSGFYTADMPTQIHAGLYHVLAKEQAGSGALETDDTVGEGDIDWDGVLVVPPPGPPAPPQQPHTVCKLCPPVCASVFDRVHISHALRGGTRVWWELLPTFLDPLPHQFQLQAGTTANQDADDWVNVGLPIIDTFYAIDEEQRIWGKTNWSHYRVKLTTSLGVYYSTPVNGLGIPERREWLLARDIVRQERLRSGLASQEGYLLKRRINGQACECLDPMTREVRRPDCPLCFGTGWRCGFFFPMGCVYADLSPRSHRTELDGGKGRGTINDVVVKARMVVTVPLFEGDLWVGRRTDDRYYVHRVEHLGEIKGVPLIAQVELRLAAVSDVAYTLVIPEQVVTA